MDDAAFVGIHRLELERSSAGAHTLCEFADALHDVVFAHRAVHLAIDHNFLRVFVLRLQEAVEQKLQRFERFAVAPNQPVTFLGVNLQDQIARFVLRLFDLNDEAEITKDGVE